MPAVMLNPVYGGASASRKGDPYAAAALLNRLQQASTIPLIATADFEGGAAYIMNGATRLPRAMAIGATRDPQLAFKAGELAATEGRSLGIHVDYYPVVDVNNNPRNPIINIRSFGEDVDLVIEMASRLHEGDPGRRHAVDGEALPRARRHRHRHAHRPGAHRAPTGAARQGGAGALPRRSSPPASTR